MSEQFNQKPVNLDDTLESTSLQQQIIDLQNLIGTQDQDINTLKTEIIAVNDRNNTLSAELSNANERIETAMGVLTEYDTLLIEFEETRSALELAVDKLKERDEDRKKFFSGASHDFKTPISAILGATRITQTMMDAAIKDLSELIDNQTDSGLDQQAVMRTGILKVSKKLTTISNGVIKLKGVASTLDSLVQDLLNTMKLDRGNLDLEIEDDPVDIKKLFEDIGDVISLQLNKKKLTIKFPEEKDYAGIELRTDQVQFRRIIINLISNAISASPDKDSQGHNEDTITDVIVKLESDLINDSIPGISIVVEDHGRGIKTEDLENLGNLFHTIKGVSTGGHGLGLFNVKSIASLMGGNLEMKSEGLNKGARFIIRIPLDQRNL